MHDTAFYIGTLAMNIYADLRSDSILEIGSQSLNGGLRENALPTTRYVGVDIEAGEGVDVVVESGKPLPVEEGSFDLVMATSVFEHDPFFWMTFLEMCRAAKDGGYIYINAPSNGVVHRYPQDNWRFYPDSGRALAAWAALQGTPVTVVESFIAARDKDIWNDFVAVFRKGPIKRALPKVFLHEQVPCTDIITWKSKEIVSPSEQPEDVILLRQSEERARLAEEELVSRVIERDSVAQDLASLKHEQDQLKTRLAETEDERQRQLADAAKSKNELNLRESELRQREEEIEQTRSELAKALADLQLGQAERDELRVNLKFVEEELQLLRSDHSAAEAALEQSQSGKAALEARLHNGFREIAALSKLLAEGESERQQLLTDSEWLRDTGAVLLNGSATWKGRILGLVPAVFHYKRQRKLLKRKGLFDCAAYLAAHPDVAADRADPLRHYLMHGLNENRPRR
jgi:hypothetical protein